MLPCLMSALLIARAHFHHIQCIGSHRRQVLLLIKLVQSNASTDRHLLIRHCLQRKPDTYQYWKYQSRPNTFHHRKYIPISWTHPGTDLVNPHQSSCSSKFAPWNRMFCHTVCGWKFGQKKTHIGVRHVCMQVHLPEMAVHACGEDCKNDKLEATRV